MPQAESGGPVNEIPLTKEAKVSTNVTRKIEVNASMSRSGSVPFA